MDSPLPAAAQVSIARSTVSRVRVSRLLSRLFLRLRQSRKSLLVAAGTSASGNPRLAERLLDMSHSRHQFGATLAGLAVGAGLGWRTRRDVADRVRRAWLRVVGRTGPGAVLDECDRGESRLLRAVEAVTAIKLPSEMESHLATVRGHLEKDIKWLEHHRLADDSIAEADRSEPDSLEVGGPMPSFRAPASTGQTLDSERFRGKLPLVIFFVPDSMSRRSGRRIGEFNRNLGRFGQLRTQVIGVVPETVGRIRRQAELKGYNLPLLSDPDESIHRAFGIDDAGNPHWATFVVDRDGTIARAYRPTLRPGHAQQVLASIRALKADSATPMDPIVSTP